VNTRAERMHADIVPHLSCAETPHRTLLHPPAPERVRLEQRLVLE
jgi:hypothetical protein